MTGRKSLSADLDYADFSEILGEGRVDMVVSGQAGAYAFEEGKWVEFVVCYR